MAGEIILITGGAQRQERLCPAPSRRDGRPRHLCGHGDGQR